MPLNKTDQLERCKMNNSKRSRIPSQALADYLRSAQPRLIVELESKGGRAYEISRYISEGERPSEETMSEGYDPDNSPLGPVYWRIVKRESEEVYYSTFPVWREKVVEIWGTQGLAYCDPITGIAVARIETKLRSKE
jgi:hypothetical protein